MADSEKPTPKKVVALELNQVSAPKHQLKPAPKKVLVLGTMTTYPVKCVCEKELVGYGYCFVCNKYVFNIKKREELPLTQAPVDDIEDDEVLDSNEEPVHKDKKKKDDKPHIQYPRQHVCVYKWGQIVVGQKYKAMSVGQESRSRTGLVLVPIDD